MLGVHSALLLAASSRVSPNPYSKQKGRKILEDLPRAGSREGKWEAQKVILGGDTPGSRCPTHLHHFQDADSTGEVI